MSREAKERLRRALRGGDPSAAAAAVAAWALAPRALELVERFRPDVVALFAAKPDEIPTRPLFEVLRAAGWRCALPRCVGSELEFALVAQWDQLVPGRYGVAEPQGGERVDFGSGDLLFVPGVAFDAQGGRLGRGAGFYDRSLLACSGLRVGLCYEKQIVERVPLESHDEAVDAVLSEARSILISPRARGEAR